MVNEKESWMELRKKWGCVNVKRPKRDKGVWIVE